MEPKINIWRRSLHRLRLEPGQVAELEQHLRDTVNELLIKGHDEERAFEEAVKRIGNPKNIARQEWNVSGKRQRRSRMPALVPVYFTQAWRHLRRAKAHTLITLTGLVAGLTACILLAIYVRFENSYDRFHQRPEQVYQVVTYFTKDVSAKPLPLSYQNLAWNIMDKVPGVVAATGVQTALLNRAFTEGTSRAFTLDMVAADAMFNNVFHFPLENGGMMSLDRPGAVYLTRSAADRIFGKDESVGRIIRMPSTGLEFEVAGILKDLPGNTHFKFDAVAPSLGAHEENTGKPISWGALMSVTYVRLAESTPPDSVAKAVSAFSDGMQYYNDNHMVLLPLTDIHLGTLLPNPFKANGDHKTIRLFAFIALIILMIACLNTAMIAFSEYMKRIREIGMRKILGADTMNIASQFVAEQLIRLVIAIPVAVLLAWALLPQLSAVMDRYLGRSLILYSDIVLLSAGIVAAVVMLSGIIPALLVYRNQSRASLSGQYLSGRLTRIMRNGAIATQFGLGIFLIIYLLGIFSQLKYVRSQDLGYNPQGLMVVSALSVQHALSPFREQLAQLPEVESASLADWSPRFRATERFDSTANRPVLLHTFRADMHTLTTLGLKLLEGQDFTPEMPTRQYIHFGHERREDGTWSSTPSNPVVVSQSYLSLYKIEEPAIGKYTLEPTGRIVGVVADYNHSSLHQHLGAVAFVNTSTSHNLLLRYRPGTEKELIPKLEAMHAELSGGLPVSYEFVDEILDAHYEADRRQSQLVGLAIAVALTLSLMGLFGMLAFSLERRTKEIGIRKVLGADVSRLVWTLTKDIYALVAIGAAFAAPFAYRLLDGWLEQYAYRFEPGWDLAALALAAAVIPVALLVVWQAGRAALENPVKALRSE